MTSVFKFTDKSACYSSSEAFLARVDPAIVDADELLRSLYYLLWFPGYFGFNWNSLYDCLRDLNWIIEKKVVIVHESLPCIPDSDLCIYLGVLKDSILDWKDDETHQLEVFFHEKDKEMIEKLFLSC
ncbi:barstar family protein [Pantoea coffeiphila]|uniref:barstar family protein n=1 Tax=Pantoea coffeiphila TaxID=1465635 RepID=UPI001C0EB457|nr:barstar family protein [Pantoea coffeiphila]